VMAITISMPFAEAMRVIRAVLQANQPEPKSRFVIVGFAWDGLRGFGPPVDPVRQGVARPGGFEPPTHSLEGCCSIQLS
jgi:hypothetical protein